MPVSKRIRSRALSNDLSAPIKEHQNQLKTIKETHKEFLRRLKWYNHHEEFYTLVNLKKAKITWSHGIRTWLGHDTGRRSALKLDFITELIHPLLRDWYKTYQDAAFLVMAKNKTALKELEYRFVVTVPIKKADGTYVMVKQMSMPYEYDKNNKVVTFINSYTLISKFQYMPMQVEFFRVDKKLEGKWVEDFDNYVDSCIQILDAYKLKPHLQRLFIGARDKFNNGNEIKIKGIRNKDLSPEMIRIYKRKLLIWLINVIKTPGYEEDIKHLFPSTMPFDELFEYLELSGITRYIEKHI